MKKTAAKFFAAILVLLIAASAGIFAACGGNGGEAVFVKIEMASLPDVTEYETGGIFSPSGGSIDAVYSDGGRTSVALDADGVELSSPDMSTPGEKRVFVTYSGDTTSFAITVKDAEPIPVVTEMAVSALPAVTDYVLGGEFSAEGGSLLVSYADGTSETVSMTDPDVIVSEPDMNMVGPQTVSVSYGNGSAQFTINIDFETAPTASVTSVTVKTVPDLTEYEEGETFSPAGGVLEVTYDDGMTFLVSMGADGVTFEGADTNVPGTAEVTVTYGGVSAMFEIVVLSSGSTVSSENVRTVTWAVRPDLSDKEYFIGDELDISDIGGEITVVYRDGTSITVPITMRGITIGDVDTTTAGSKTVRVSVGVRYVTFTVTVLELGGTVTFDANYDGGEDAEVRFAVNRTITRRANDPVRNGYTFRGWYEDETCTVPYEFDRDVINGDMSVYASWTADATPSAAVTYDMNYYGVRVRTYTQYVQSGDPARRLYRSELDSPVRSEYRFDGWFADKACSVRYDLGAAVTEDTTIYAGWTKTKTGTSTYTFEAENVSLEGMEGPGASGSQTGADMIVLDTEGIGASGGAYVSYLYKEGLTLDFEIASGEDVTDATIEFYVAADKPLNVDIPLDPESYRIEINGEAQSYAAVTLTQERHGAFGSYITLTGVHLREGSNSIKMITNNDRNPVGEGVGTYAGTAPIVDCIKITTSVVLMWDETAGLPANV